MTEVFWIPAVAGVIATVFHGAIFFGLKTRPPNEPESMVPTQEKAVFSILSLLKQLTLLFGIAAVFAAMYYLLLVSAYKWSLTFRPNGILPLGPSRIDWVFLATNPALFSAAAIFDRLNLLQSDPRKRSAFLRLRGIWIFFSILQILFITLSFDCYTRFETDRMMINKLISFGEIEHPYTDVDRIIISAYYGGRHGGKGTREDRLHLLFHDGTQWENIDAGWFSINDDPALLKEVLDLLQTKTAKTLEHVETIESVLEQNHRIPLHSTATSVH
jgi:hypothetical protein